MMRIVSLTPAGTEIAFALGLGRDVVGVSHDSDWPPDAAACARVTEPPADEEPTPSPQPTADLSRHVRLDRDRLVELRPDLVLAPGTHEIEPSPGDTGLRAIVAGVGADAELLTLDPTSLEGILHSITTVGAMTGAEAAALRLIERLRARLGRLERRVQRRREQGRAPTRVIALEGLDPPVAAGRWIPEQVRRGGGWELLGREGEAAIATTWGSVRDVDPEAVVLMPRGRHLDAAVELWAATPRPDGWDDLEAVRRGQVFAVDAESYFTRPGPRVFEGIALLAEVLDPDGFVDTSPLASWTPVD